MGWKEILMEDILRLAKEKSSPPSFSDITEDNKVTKEEVEDALKELERKNLVKRDNGRITLTEEGMKAAEAIYAYHKIVEEIFGHKVAHSFEHMRDKVRYIERAGESTPLTDFKNLEEGVIVSMEVENPKIIARLMGVGLTPGAKFRVIKNGDPYVLEVGRRLVIIDKGIARLLRGVRRDESTLSGPA